MKKLILITLSITLFGCGNTDRDLSNEDFIKEIVKISTANNQKLLYQPCLIEKSQVLTNKEKELVLKVLDDILKIITPPLTDEKKDKAAEILLKDKEVNKAYSKYANKVVDVCRNSN